MEGGEWSTTVQEGMEVGGDEGRSHSAAEDNRGPEGDYEWNLWLAFTYNGDRRYVWRMVANLGLGDQDLGQ